MRLPCLHVYVANNQTLVISKTYSQEEGEKVIVELTPQEAFPSTFEDAAARLGGTLFGILKLWHKQFFDSSQSNDLSLPESVGDEAEYDLAHELITLSINKKTAAYVSAIESLLISASDLDNQSNDFRNNSWPLIKERLRAYGP